jgi:hypothetical protein
MLAELGPAQTRPAAPKPLDKDQIMALVGAGMDNEQLAKKVQALGIDFEPTDEYLEALRKAGAQDVLLHALRASNPEPMTQQQVLALVAGGVPTERATALIKQRGVVFVPDEKYLATLRVAGADEGLIAAVREAGATLPGSLEISTAPNAHVDLDGAAAGRAGNDGALTLPKIKPGPHQLRITLAAKKDFEQTVNVEPAAVNKISATLTDLPGGLKINSTAGAEVYVDGTSRGKTDSSGTLVLTGVTPGSHRLRVTGQTNRKDYEQSVDVSAGQEGSILALGEALPGHIRVRATPGARVLDGDDDKIPGIVKFNGEFSWEAKPGGHMVRVQEDGRPEFRNYVSVSAGETSAVDAPKTEIPATGKRVDRLYGQGPDKDGYLFFFRFYPDGSLVGGNAKGTWADVERSAANRKSQGDAYLYQMQGSTIRWSQDGSWPTYFINYKGTIRGNTLTTETCCYENKPSIEVYHLIESGPTGGHSH